LMAPRTPHNLVAALGFLQVPANEPELQMLHRWIDCWRGVGEVSVGMHRQGWDLQMTEYGNGHWRATFYVTGMTHSIIGGSAYEQTPWQAVQQAAWAAVSRNLGA